MHTVVPMQLQQHQDGLLISLILWGTTGTSLTPKDTTPPTITANGATVIKNEKIVDIPVTAEDNKGGVGMRPNNPIEVTGLPQGLTFTNGKITGTPTGPVGNSTVTIKAYDKNGNKAEKNNYHYSKRSSV